MNKWFVARPRDLRVVVSHGQWAVCFSWLCAGADRYNLYLVCVDQPCKAQSSPQTTMKHRIKCLSGAMFHVCLGGVHPEGSGEESGGLTFAKIGIDAPNRLQGDYWHEEKRDTEFRCAPSCCDWFELLNVNSSTNALVRRNETCEACFWCCFRL